MIFLLGNKSELVALTRSGGVGAGGSGPVRGGPGRRSEPVWSFALWGKADYTLKFCCFSHPEKHAVSLFSETSCIWFMVRLREVQILASYGMKYMGSDVLLIASFTSDVWRQQCLALLPLDRVSKTCLNFLHFWGYLKKTLKLHLSSCW